MNTNLNASNVGHVQKTHCHPKEQSTFNRLINIIEKICAVALGAFSLYINWKLFIPFFFVGVCIGAYSYIQDNKSCGVHHPASSCAHGLVEQLTGVKLPPVISLAANIAVTVCHIDHHDTVFVPIIGISLGNWVGKTAAHYGVLAHKKILNHPNKITNFSKLSFANAW